MKAVFTAMLLCLACENAFAGNPEADAKVYYASGQSLASSGQYIEAIAQFTAGYTLSKKPLFLFNIAECARLAGDRQQALANYDRYVVEAPQGKLAKVASERAAELRAEIAATQRPPAPTVEPPKSAVAAPPPAPAPVVAPVAVRPPPPAAHPTSPGTDLVVATPPTERKPVWKRTGFWVGIGAAAAVVIVGASLTAWAVTRNSSGCTGTCVDLGQ